MRKALSIVISISLLTSQMTYGAGLSEALYTAESAIEAYGAKSVRYGFNKEGGYALSLMNEEKQVVKTMVFPKATPESLKAVSPSELEKDVVAFQKQSAKQIAINAAVNLKRFPWEAFTFFVALGAIATKDLVFNFSKDPTAIETFLNGQVSAPGQVGFGAFMYMNSVTTQAAMQSALRNKQLFNFAIPYFGMSAGMTASKIVTDIMVFPGYGLMEKCVSLKAGSQKKDEIKKACDEAYVSWHDYHFGRKMGQIAPSLISMIAASGIMAGAWMAAEKAVAATAGLAVKVLAAKGIELALTINEVGLVVKGVEVISWGIQLANLAGFIEINDYLEAPILKLWNNNVTVGPALLRLRTQITFDAISGTNKERMIGNLDEFAKTMEEWQQNNSQETLTAHNHWINYLSDLGSGHDVAQAFYKDFVDDVWKNKFGQPGEKMNLLRSYPLYGVMLPNGQDANAAGYLQGADVREQDQKSVMNYYGTTIEKDIKTNATWFNSLYPGEKETLNKMVATFKSDNLSKIGETLLEMSWFVRPGAHARGNVYHNSSFSKYINDLYASLHKPTPMLMPGQGYLRAREMSYKESEFIFPKDLNAQYDNKLSVLIGKMISGDEVDGKPWTVIGSTHGFKAEFNYPRISTGRPDLGNRAHSALGTTEDTAKIIQYLSDRGIRNEILGTAGSKQSNLANWWAQNIEPEYINAWVDFGNKYEKIVSDFMNDLKKDPRPPNYIEFSKGLVSSTEQEIKAYADVLKQLGSKEQKEKSKAIVPLMNIAFADVAKAISEIKPKLEQSRLSKTEFKFDSHISNAQIEQIAKSLKGSLAEIMALDQADADKRYSSEDLAIAKSATEHMTKAFEKLTGYIQIVNAVSYKEKYQNGYYEADKCTELKGSGKTLNANAVKGCLSAAVGQ